MPHETGLFFYLFYLQLCHLFIIRKCWFECWKNSFHSHMHKMGPWGPKQYIFGNHFCSKNARTLRFHVFLHFNARKHMTSSFFLRWTEFTRNCKFIPIWFGSPQTHNWSKIHNFLWIWSTSCKMMMSYLF